MNLDSLDVEQSRILNQLAVQVRSEFPELIEKIASMPKIDIYWAVSNIASRNKYYSPLFFRCCQIELVKRHLDTGLKEVITSDYHLYKILKAKYKNIDIALNSSSFFKQLKDNIRPLWKYALIMKQYVLRLLASSKKGRVLKSDSNKITLLDTYVINSSVGENGSITDGVYKDRYYPGLLNSLSQNEKKNVFYVPVTIGFKNYFSAFKKIRSSTTQFLVRDDYLEPSDYFFALLLPFRLLKKKQNKVYWRGTDILPLIKSEIWQTCVNFNSMEGLLNYRYAYRIAKEKINIRLYIEWYENQPMDKGAIAGFHQFLPTTKVVGYQGYIISKLLHHYIYPTAFEMRHKLVPDEVAVIGKGLMSDIKEFCSDVNVITAPAFRNQNVWHSIECDNSNEFYLLIALPMDKREVWNILSMVEKAVNEICKEINIIIKPHPSYGPDKLTSHKYIAEKKIKIVTGNFESVVKKNMLVMTNASITAVEAVALGVPSIIIGDLSGILQNPIPEDVPEILSRVCYTPDDILQAVNHYRDLYRQNTVNFFELGNDVRKNYFEKYSIDKSREFLKLPLA